VESDESEDKWKVQSGIWWNERSGDEKELNVMESDQLLGYDGGSTGCRVMIAEPSRHTSRLWRMLMTRNATGFSD
jgi:hypothetical protein